uniref:EF-hand domain-containing protein n=1 Tax=Strongyloides papillosus TaxID=174720 RepID=A0A0N5BGD3_STREA
MITLKHIVYIFLLIFNGIAHLAAGAYFERNPSNPICLRGSPSLMDQYHYTKSEYDEIKNYLATFSLLIGKYKDSFSFEDVIRYLVGSDGIFRHVNWEEDHDFGVVFVLLEEYIREADMNKDKILTFCEFYNYEKVRSRRKNSGNHIPVLTERLEDLYIYYHVRPQ